MSKIDKKTINIATIIAPVIHSRDAIELVRDAVENTDAESVNLDFTDVEFVSRSAAHALLVLKENLKQTKNKDLVFTNSNKDVNEMLRVVAANRAVPRHPMISLPHIERTKIKTLFQ